MTSQQCWDTLQAVNKLANHSLLTIYWVKAHVGQKYNERADTLAKAGIAAPRGRDVGLNRRSHKSRYNKWMRERWLQRWQQSPHYRQTKLWFPSLDGKKSRSLLKFGRCKLGTLVQWITGFCNLMRHKHLKNNYIDPMCRRCNMEEETPFHLTYYCPALLTPRVNCFQTWEGSNQAWTPYAVDKFIMESNSEMLLQDEEVYD